MDIKQAYFHGFVEKVARVRKSAQARETTGYLTGNTPPQPDLSKLIPLLGGAVSGINHPTPGRSRMESASTVGTGGAVGGIAGSIPGLAMLLRKKMPKITDFGGGLSHIAARVPKTSRTEKAISLITLLLGSAGGTALGSDAARWGSRIEQPAVGYPAAGSLGSKGGIRFEYAKQK